MTTLTKAPRTSATVIPLMDFPATNRMDARTPNRLTAPRAVPLMASSRRKENNASIADATIVAMPMMMMLTGETSRNFRDRDLVFQVVDELDPLTSIQVQPACVAQRHPHGDVPAAFGASARDFAILGRRLARRSRRIVRPRRARRRRRFRLPGAALGGSGDHGEIVEVTQVARQQREIVVESSWRRDHARGWRGLSSSSRHSPRVSPACLESNAEGIPASTRSRGISTSISGTGADAPRPNSAPSIQRDSSGIVRSGS